MKKLANGIFFILCLLLCMGIALCEEAAPYTPEEIDLSGVRRVGDRLVGEVALPAYSALPLKIDCLIPADFTEEQSVRLTVDYPKITKQQLKETLQTLGIAADEKKGTFGQFLHNPERSVWYEQDDFRYVASSSIVSARSAAYSLSAEVHAPALAAVKEIAEQIITALGGSVHIPLLQAEHYDEHLVWPFTTTWSTADGKLKELARRTFRQNREKYGPKGDDVYIVHGLYDVMGLPVLEQGIYVSGGDRCGYSLNFSGIFQANGELMGLEINCLPVVKSGEDFPLPERSWEELLKQWISNCYSDGYSIGEDETYQSNVFGEVTNYASYSVLTELQPCWITPDKFQLEPGYNAVIEVRVQKDHSLVSVWSHSTDALTLTKNEY